MQIRELSPDHAVSPQITPEDLPEIRAAGFVAVICNRPDAENPPDLAASVLRTAAESEGLTFVDNPATHAMTPEMVAAQSAAIRAAGGRVLAYCASGNRSAILWALNMAGAMPVDEILEATRRAGYDHERLRAGLEALAARNAP